MPERTRHVATRLSEREYQALRAYCESYGISISSCLRVAVLPEIPPKFWPKQKPPPGQLTLEGVH